MRILFIHNRYRLEGGEDLAVDLEAELLREHGHSVETLLFDNATIEDSVGKWTALKNFVYNSESADMAREAIGRFRPELVHVHNLFFVASPSVLDAADRAGIPVVMTLHNYRLICCNAIMLRDGKPCEICRNSKLPLAGIRYKCYRGSAAASALVTAVTGIHKFRQTWRNKVSLYIALTAFARQKMAGSSLQVPVEQIQVLPNFVRDFTGGTHNFSHSILNGTEDDMPDAILDDRLDKFPAAFMPAANRESFFLFAGRLTPEKGIIPLVHAFRNMPDMPLLVAGDGPDRALMESEAGGAPNIRFLGPVPREELLRLMQRCRALLFPSIWYEGLPYVIIEAFCAGTPVIASGLGAMQSLIEDKVNGLHFTPGNPDHLTRVVREFLQSGLPLYAGARASWERNFAPAHHYEALMKIYSSVLRRV